MQTKFSLVYCIAKWFLCAIFILIEISEKWDENPKPVAFFASRENFLHIQYIQSFIVESYLLFSTFYVLPAVRHP